MIFYKLDISQPTGVITMQERFRDESTKETGIERTKYFDQLFNMHKNIPSEDMGKYRQAFMFTVPKKIEKITYYNEEGERLSFIKKEIERNIFLLNNGDSGSIKIVPHSAVIDRKLLSVAGEIAEKMKDEAARRIMERSIDRALNTYVKGLESIANLDHQEYKERFKNNNKDNEMDENNKSKAFGDNSAYINPRKIRNICERGTTGNICYSYNYATGQIGFHIYRGDKWNEDIAVEMTGTKKNKKRIEKFREYRGTNNENNLVIAQIVDKIMENAKDRLLSGDVRQEDMEKIINAATGMPTVYMGMALLDCPEEREKEYKKIDEQYKKDKDSVAVNKLFYDIHDFFKDDKTARNFFSFEDCGERGMSSFGERVTAFRNYAKKMQVENESVNRFKEKDLAYVTGPCEYYANIQRWNNNEDNVINSSLGLLIGDIDIVNAKIDGDKLLISVHEGKSAVTEKAFKNYWNNNEIKTPSVDSSQEILYRVFMNMLRIGTEGKGLYISIDGKQYKVELDGQYNKIHGSSKCIIDKVMIENPVEEITEISNGKNKTKITRNEYMTEYLLDKKLDNISLPYFEKTYKGNINKYVEAEWDCKAFYEKTTDKEFHTALKRILKNNKDIQDNEQDYRYCLCSMDSYALTGMDLFYHCRQHGITEGKDNVQEDIKYPLRTSLFVVKNNGRTEPNDRAVQSFVARGNLPMTPFDNEYDELSQKQSKWAQRRKELGGEDDWENKLTEDERKELVNDRKRREEIIQGKNMGFKAWQNNILSGINNVIGDKMQGKSHMDKGIMIAEATKILAYEYYDKFYTAFAIDKMSSLDDKFTEVKEKLQDIAAKEKKAHAA